MPDTFYLNRKETLQQALRALERLRVKRLCVDYVLTDDGIPCIGCVISNHALSARSRNALKPVFCSLDELLRFHYDYDTEWHLIYNVSEKFLDGRNDEDAQSARYQHVKQYIENQLKVEFPE